MGSTYSYLSVMRLKEVEQASGIRFNWRPFHLLIILQEMKHVPFADKPAKAAYMWRDIERRATMYGIPAALPAPYPAKQSIVANLVATVGMRQGWGTDLVPPRIVAGFNSGMKRAASRMYRKVCVRLARSLNRCSHWRTRPTPRMLLARSS